MDTERQIFGVVLQAAQDLVQTVMTLPVPAMVGILCAPMLLALLSRNAMSVGAAAFMSLLSYAALMQDDPSRIDFIISLAVYAGAVFAGLHGHNEARHARRIASVSQEIDQLRLEMEAFLAAVDRRTLAIDQFARHDSIFAQKEPGDRPGFPQEA